MVRNVLAVIASYVFLALFVMIGLAVAFMAMGMDTAYQPGSYKVSMAWIVVMEATGLIASVLAGMLCVKISKQSLGAVKSFLIVVVVLGILNIVMTAMADERTAESLVRPEGVEFAEAVKNTYKPVWIAALDPIVGFIGISLGAMLIWKKGGASRREELAQD